MDHWLRGFTNMALPRRTFVAAKWARLVELVLAYRLWLAATRFRFLCVPERGMALDEVATFPEDAASDADED